jgi:hypothetical protein
MTYQRIAGTLNANQHGSYTTQDAFGDLLVTDVKSSMGRYADMHNPNCEKRRGGSVCRIKTILMQFWKEVNL